MVSLGKESRPDLHTPVYDAHGNSCIDQRSWSLEEYLNAVQEDAFFQSMENKPWVNVEQEADERFALVKSKYDVAGGKARLMFHNPSEIVIEAQFIQPSTSSRTREIALESHRTA